MTLRIIDGFDYFSTSVYTSMAAAMGWSGFGSSSFNPDTFTAFSYGKSLMYDGGTSSNSNTVTRWLRGRYTQQSIFGARIYVPTTGAGYYLGTNDSQSTANRQWDIEFDSQGNLRLYSWAAAPTSPYSQQRTLIAQTPAFTFTPGRWFYFEVKWTPHLTAGSIEVRINTVVVLSITGIRLANGDPIAPATGAGHDFLNLNFNHLNGGAVDGWRIDDFYFLTCDGANNNDYLGNVRVKSMPPIGQSSVQFAIGGSAPAATNWQSVLNSNLDDTQYVYSSTVGNKDLYNVDPVVNAPLVYGVEINGSYRQDDATQRFAKSIISSAGVEAEGASHALNQSYTFFADIYETNPATGLQFTGTEVNALLMGPKVDV